MGVYIPKKTMPQNCSFCPCARMNVSRNGIECSAVNFYAENLMPQKGRMECCPLVEVPPHGDLIDRDALIKDGWSNLHKEVMRMGGYAIHELPLKNPTIPVVIEREND